MCNQEAFQLYQEPLYSPAPYCVGLAPHVLWLVDGADDVEAEEVVLDQYVGGLVLEVDADAEEDW